MSKLIEKYSLEDVMCEDEQSIELELERQEYLKDKEAEYFMYIRDCFPM